jgi:hypothetical protein
LPYSWVSYFSVFIHGLVGKAGRKKCKKFRQWRKVGTLFFAPHADAPIRTSRDLSQIESPPNDRETTPTVIPPEQ